MTGIQQAVNHYGSPSRLAVAMADGTSRQNIEYWLRAGVVPPERVMRLTEIAPVEPWDLRPEDWHLIWPSLARKKNAPPAPTTKAAA